MAVRRVGPLLLKLNPVGTNYPLWYNADDIRLVFQRPGGAWVVRICEPQATGRSVDMEVPEVDAVAVIARLSL